MKNGANRSMIAAEIDELLRDPVRLPPALAIAVVAEHERCLDDGVAALPRTGISAQIRAQLPGLVPPRSHRPRHAHPSTRGRAEIDLS